MVLAWHLLVHLLLELLPGTERQDEPGLAMWLLQKRHTDIAKETNAVTHDAEVWD